MALSHVNIQAHCIQSIPPLAEGAGVVWRKDEEWGSRVTFSPDHWYYALFAASFASLGLHFSMGDLETMNLRLSGTQSAPIIV